MYLIARWSLWCGGLALVFAGLGLLMPAISTLTGVDFKTVIHLFEVYEQENSRKSTLASRQLSIDQNLAGKEQAVQELIAGNLTLNEAAFRFQILNQECAEFNWGEFRRANHGDDDFAKHRHQVMVVSRHVARIGGGQWESAMARLEKEFRQAQAQNAAF
jgi:hypothetical protein